MQSLTNGTVLMNNLHEFTLPLQGLKTGFHQFNFDLNKKFFSNFDQSPVQGAEIHMNVSVDKMPQTFVLKFSHQGHIQTDCDRCLAPINLPISGEDRIILKLSLEEAEIEGDDVIYLSPKTTEYNIAQLVYEAVVLNLPTTNVYDCTNDSPPPCLTDTLHILSGLSAQANEPIEEEEPTTNPVWEILKKLNTQ